MILDTIEIAALDDITSATLNLSAKGGSSLSLDFAGFPPAWVQYMEPVTLMHRGKVLFHGKITSLPATSSGGEITSSVKVDDVFFLLDHQTLATQLAVLQEQAQASADNAQGSGQASAKGWQSAKPRKFKEMAEAISITANGWVPDLPGFDPQGCTVSVAVSSALDSRILTRRKSKGMTTATALLHAREDNPDSLLLVDFATAAVTMRTIDESPVLTLSSDEIPINSADGIEPQYTACVTGVVCAVEGNVSYQYPKEIDLADTGVKVFDVAGKCDYERLARQYYEAANVLQWGGSISLHLDDLETIPIGCRINLMGEGMHPAWETMQAVCTSASVDLMERTVSLLLGHDWADPQFAETAECDVDDPEDESDTTQDDDSTDDSTDDGGDVDGGQSTSDWGDWESGTGRDDESASYDETWDSRPATGTGTGTGDTANGTHTGTRPGTHPGGTTNPPTPGTTNPPAPGTTNPPSPGTSPGTGGGSCNCSACPKLEQFRELIAEILQGRKVELGGTTSDTAQTNDNGTITVTTTWRY